MLRLVSMIVGRVFVSQDCFVVVGGGGSAGGEGRIWGFHVFPCW